jgi:ParB family transcriptional regulator, chromosome partitioning protein
LKLGELIPEIKKAFVEGAITAGHAILLARLSKKQQKDLLDRFHFHLDGSWSVRHLADVIQREHYFALESAPWDKSDSKLLPKAGACDACPKRIADDALGEDDNAPLVRCADRECFERKLELYLRRRFEEVTEKHLNADVARVAIGYGGREEKSAIAVWDYKRIETKAERCESARPALVVAGDFEHLGEEVEICTNKKCSKHGSYSAGGELGESSKAREERKRTDQKLEAKAEALRRTMKLVLEKVSWPLPRAVLALILEREGVKASKLSDKELAVKLVDNLAGEDYKGKWFKHVAGSNTEIPALAKIYGVKLGEPDAAPAAKPKQEPKKKSRQRSKPAARAA